MPFLTNIALVIVTCAHLLFGLGNLLGVPPQDLFLAKETGPGVAGMERLLQWVFAGWYISSIIGVLVAYNRERREHIKSLFFNRSMQLL